MLVVESAKVGLDDRPRRGLEGAVRGRLRPRRGRGGRPRGPVDADVPRRLGTLVKNGLLDRALVNDWLWVAGTWERVGPAAKRARAKLGEPRLFENYEALAAGQQ